jgi:hypothetical protein
MIPADPEHALEVRFMDRVFDHHVLSSNASSKTRSVPRVTAI